MSFTELLAQPGVVEEAHVRGTFGFLAYHGGPVERVTTMIASQAAADAGATFYGIDQPPDRPLHLPSTRYSPDESATFRTVLEHVDVVCTIHGYGRQALRWSLLLGGRNRIIAAHVAGHLRTGLPMYDIIDDLAEIPKELAGQHEDNPVNRARHGGVQIELPPLLRWNQEEWGWSDSDGRPRAPQLQELIFALADAGATWIAQANGDRDTGDRATGDRATGDRANAEQP